MSTCVHACAHTYTTHSHMRTHIHTHMHTMQAEIGGDAYCVIKQVLIKQLQWRRCSRMLNAVYEVAIRLQTRQKQTNQQTKGSQNPYRFLKTISLFNVTNLILGKNDNSPSWVTTTLLLNSSWQPWQGPHHSCELWVRRWQSEQSCTLNLEVSLFNSLVLFPYLLPSGQLWFSSFQEG